MTIVLEVLLVVSLFAIFGYVHSVLASNKIKNKIVELAGNKIAYYRLFYNLQSILFFFVIYEVSPKPDIIIYDLQYPWDIVIFGLQLLSLVGFIWAIKFIDGKEFLGINQIIRFKNNNYNIDDLDEQSELVIKGPFKYSRHPIYFFSILFLGFRPIMDLFYITFYICIILYFVIGSIYEEKKLVEKFGVQYKEYQKSVPSFIPYKIFKKY